MKIVWSPTAIQDLKHVRFYIAQDSPTAAESVAKRIMKATERLVEFPSSGRPGRIPDTRELVIDGTPFVIPYTVDENVVKIIAVLHQARKWPAE